MELSIEVRSVLSWVQKGGLAVLDQALFSGANFLVNILLARWLAPKEYGAFAVALSIFYLLAGFHTAVLTEPMMVFGAGKYRKQFRKYLGMLLYGHWGISALISLGLAGAAWFFLRRGSPLGEALLGLAVAAPFLLLLWLTRRACYANLRPAWAVGGSAVNLFAVLAGLFLLWRAGLLSTLTGLVLLGAAAGTGSLALTILYLRPRVWGFSSNPTPGMVVGDHWKYGVWTLTESVIYSVTNHLLVMLIPIFLGLAGSGAFAATRNFYRPINLLTQGLTLVLLPTFSTWARSTITSRYLYRKAVKIGIALGLGVVIYTVLITVNWYLLVQWVYRGKYSEYAVLSLLIGLSYAFNTLGYSAVLVLKARQRLKKIPVLLGIPGLLSLTLFVILTLFMGLFGSALAYLIGRIIFAVYSIQVMRERT